MCFSILPPCLRPSCGHRVNLERGSSQERDSPKKKQNIGFRPCLERWQTGEYGLDVIVEFHTRPCNILPSLSTSKFSSSQISSGKEEEEVPIVRPRKPTHDNIYLAPLCICRAQTLGEWAPCPGQIEKNLSINKPATSITPRVLILCNKQHFPHAGKKASFVKSTNVRQYCSAFFALVEIRRFFCRLQ